MELTRDAFLDGKLLLDQPLRGFRSGLDAVFLAAACPASGQESVLDAGCGTGAAMLCLARRMPGLSLTGVEIEHGIAALARSNAALNGFADRIRIVCADVSKTIGNSGPSIAPESFDHVIANPPYYDADQTRASAERSRARSMERGALDSWLRYFASAARPDGTCTVIHRTEALSDLLAAFKSRFGGVRILPVHAKPGMGAIRVIVSGTKGSKAPLTLLCGLTLQLADGTPSPIATEVLRAGGSLGIEPRHEKHVRERLVNPLGLHTFTSGDDI